MKSFSGYLDHLTDSDRNLYGQVLEAMGRARAHMEADTQKFSRISFNCHAYSFGLAKIMPALRVATGQKIGLDRVPYQDGSATQPIRLLACAHSWLVTPDNAIIDPYPVAMDSPDAILVVTRGIYAPFGGNLYRSEPEVDKEHINRRVLFTANIFARIAA